MTGGSPQDPLGWKKKDLESKKKRTAGDLDRRDECSFRGGRPGGDGKKSRDALEIVGGG